MIYRSYLHISNLTNEHSLWTQGISFYKDELNTLHNRLNEFPEDLKTAGIADQITQYKTEFDTHEKSLETLKKDIDSNFNLIKEDIESKEMHVGNSTLAETDSLRDRYVQLEKAVNHTRHTFNRFFCDHVDVVLR